MRDFVYLALRVVLFLETWVFVPALCGWLIAEVCKARSVNRVERMLRDLQEQKKEMAVMKNKPTDEEIRMWDARMGTASFIWYLRVAWPLVLLYVAFLLPLLCLLGYRWRRLATLELKDLLLMGKSLYRRGAINRYREWRTRAGCWYE